MNRKLYFFDTETCGFHGFVVLIQWAENDGEIHLHNVWDRPVQETIDLCEMLAESGVVVGFNLAFDWFQIYKAWSVFKVYVERYPNLADLPPSIDLVASCEEEGMKQDCLKPQQAVDLMLAGRKGRLQNLMNRGDIRIRRVPIELAYPLADELDSRLTLPEIYWSRQKDKTVRWRVYDIEEEPHFKDVVLKFNPAGGLKYIAEFALGITPPFHFEDVQCDAYPYELGYAPTSAAVRREWEYYGSAGECPEAWPEVIHHHIKHWRENEDARKYAWYDVHITRELYAYLNPEINDTDSVLACSVACCRWRGYTIKLDRVSTLRAEAQACVDASPINVNSVSEVRAYLKAVMDPTEQIFIMESTRKQILEEIATWTDNEEAASRASTILRVRGYQKEVELYDKLLIAERFHADFNIIGTMSSRMSGSGGLNAQGIKAEDRVRSCFELANEGEVLCGGDFSSFEVALAAAVYEDEDLHNFIVAGKKLHGVFGTLIYPGKTYDEILASAGTDFDMYSNAKSAVFAILYGGNAFTLYTNLGIPTEIGEAAIRRWMEIFPNIGRVFREITERFSAIVQNGPGFAFVGAEDFIETKMGFRRSFELENNIIELLYKLAINPPKAWQQKKIKVVRRQKIQTASGAVQSALYGAAFSIQNANIRAAGNHLIQSLGGTICKDVQRTVWDLQPSGVHRWLVQPMNVHDELLSSTNPSMAEMVSATVGAKIKMNRELYCPLLGMTWVTEAPSWADCKHGGGRITDEFKYGTSA